MKLYTFGESERMVVGREELEDLALLSLFQRPAFHMMAKYILWTAAHEDSEGLRWSSGTSDQENVSAGLLY